MTSSLPPKSRIPPVQPTSASKPALPSRPAPTATSLSSIRTSPTYIKYRSGIWAVGAAVIVIAGSLIGAKLKENQQAQAHIASLEEKYKLDSDATLVPQSNSSPATVTESVPPTRVLQAAAVADGTTARLHGAISDTQRQIAFLEDRRGVLMKQKFDLEKKLERVREKIQREEAMEGRRRVEISDGK